MYQITIVSTHSQFTLHFNNVALAQAARQNIIEIKRNFLKDKEDRLITVKDEFGHIMDLLTSSFIGCVLASVEDEGEMGVGLAIIKARYQKKANDLAQRDPILNMMSAPGIRMDG